MEKETKIDPGEEVKNWNEKYPVGTAVTRYKLTNPLRLGNRTVTASPAWVMGGHTAMVKVAGVSGGVSLDSVVAESGE